MSPKHRKVCFSTAHYIVYQPYPGLKLAYHAKRFYVSTRTRYQKIDIIDNEAYGRMLFLDNNVQHTEYDSHIFNEALCEEAKKNHCTRVLVLGGGSGQTAMSLLQSHSTKHVTVVEIDPQVVDCCKKHVRGVGRTFSNSRVRVLFGNAFDYIHFTDETFDAAVIDLTEAPFAVGNYTGTLRQLYEDIKTKCKGQCSQYVGSQVNLSYNRKFRNVLERMSRKHLSNVRFVSTFIPSFGAPHLVMHAGYAT
ncbi:MAG TPA: methyltransferase domain-containing protein [Candidatus Acidoferrales bacterium]|nr:methyltransferase domain-containing protein [Candidatus Acidoferrales bacterium]